MLNNRILVFDSGVGGLSVYQEIIRLNPSLHCYYLFDNAYFPYGELDYDVLVERLLTLLTHFITTHPVDLIVIACNTASTAALDDLRATLSVPIIGVVPAIKPAASITKNNVIGLLATPATIARGYTNTLIERFASDKTVLRIGSIKLVTLAEDKLLGRPVNVDDLLAILSPWLPSQDATQVPDTLILGCTHFPLLKSEIQACFEKPVQLVDSGEAIALRVKQLLANKQIDEERKNQTDLTANAFYTKIFNDEAALATLTASFANYGFNSLTLYK